MLPVNAKFEQQLIKLFFKITFFKSVILNLPTKFSSLLSDFLVNCIFVSCDMANTKSFPDNHIKPSSSFLATAVAEYSNSILNHNNMHKISYYSI